LIAGADLFKRRAGGGALALAGYFQELSVILMVAV